MKRIYVAVALLVLLVGLFGCSNVVVDGFSGAGSGVVGDDVDITPITIGVLSLNEGDYAKYSADEGLLLKLEEEGSELLGRPVEIIFEYSACDVEKGVTAVNKFIFVDKVDFIISNDCSGVSLAGGRIAQEEGVLFLAAGATHAAFSELGDFAYRIIPSDAAQGKKIAEVADGEGYDSVGVVYLANDYGEGLKNEFVASYQGEVLLVEGFDKDEHDFRTVLLKIKAADPSAVFFNAPFSQAALFMKQGRELGIEVQYFGSENLKGQELIELVGDIAEGMIATAPVENSDSYAVAFDEAYLARYGVEHGIFDDYGYDVLGVLFSAVEEAGSVEVSNVKRVLDELVYNGATGEISFDKKGDVTRPHGVYVVEDGEFVAIFK